ncbi:glutamate racemase [Ligilactobacillus equi]|uniref:Glutamate racemase n=1 Tax=Ligilactobacillus equi DSM 15833 = JCM 10991 TaxID=1423740 RepID=A0A0R1TJE8_9LACO|nr:glutamate racemase [Ligilactobacillus equi]KRL77595.1 glutamate racemase [Ligilactobacillus equi DSM 15833 = JCM 10991]
MNEQQKKPIGFFDSGVGGISVLKEAVKLMPQEDFIFLGDSKNAPYGTRTTTEVRALSEKIVQDFLTQDVKAIVIACNTATSAAAQYLRGKYPEIPIIGLEPALKPAVKHEQGGDVVVMATELTLREKKFSDLVARFKDQATIHRLPAPDLVELVEAGKTQAPETRAYLANILAPYLPKMDSLVLGCTHYPFVKPLLRELVGPEVEIIDGGKGASQQLKRQLAKRGWLRPEGAQGSVTFQNSNPDPCEIALSQALFTMDLGH